ncbi:MAG: ABC transporter permease subunit [Oscillospiraceae bacterium]|nr:ABC transporter permease subunit [Oscillospiraceae bacterium]
MKKRLKTYLFLLPGIGYILFFLVVIIGFMTMQSFGFFNYTGKSGFTLQYWNSLFSRRLLDSFIFSLKVGAVSSFGSLIITYLLSFAIKGSYFQKTILSIYKVPIFIPALVGSFLIINMFDYSGIVNFILQSLHIIQEPIRFRSQNSAFLVYLVQIWKNMPFQLLIMYPAIQSIRKDILDAGRNLGAGRLRLFTEIIFPLTLSTSLIAVILVFIGTFGDFAVSSTAGPIYPFSLSRLMNYTAYNQQNWGLSAAIAVFMIIVITALVSAYSYLQQKIVK